VNKLYPFDFREQEKINLKFQLHHFIVDVSNYLNFKNLSIMLKLCQSIPRSKKSNLLLDWSLNLSYFNSSCFYL